jgi:hypothetical protein
MRLSTLLVSFSLSFMVFWVYLFMADIDAGSIILPTQDAGAHRFISQTHRLPDERPRRIDAG